MIRKATVLLLATLFAVACATTDTDPNDPNGKAKRGAGVGAAAGAIVGAIIGNQSGGNRTGAVIGAAAGRGAHAGKDVVRAGERRRLWQEPAEGEQRHARGAADQPARGDPHPLDAVAGIVIALSATIRPPLPCPRFRSRRDLTKSLEDL